MAKAGHRHLGGGDSTHRVGLSVAYVRGTTELQEVIGASFQALAEDSASKVDAKIRHVIIADRALAMQAGMGWYIVQQIVKKYDGSINLESQQGEGTVCTIQFPIAEKSEEETQ